MPDNRFTAMFEEQRKLTNMQLAEKISAISSFNIDKLNQLLPQKKEKEAFIELMAQVESDAQMDQKLAYLGDNLKTAGGVIFKILQVLL